MSLSQASKEAFALEFDSVISLTSVLMDQRDIMSMDDFARNVAESYYILYPKGNVDPKRLMKDMPGYYMVYLAKNWLEKSSTEEPKNHKNKAANSSSERPYLRLVR